MPHNHTKTRYISTQRNLICFERFDFALKLKMHWLILFIIIIFRSGMPRNHTKTTYIPIAERNWFCFEA